MTTSAIGSYGEFDDAVAGDRYDYEAALRLFRRVAEHGHADAQLNLGTIDSPREGVTQDFSEATNWYRLTADQGEALAAVGSMYAYGRGVPHNNEEAMRWYRAAAAYPQSNAYAQFKIGWHMTPGCWGCRRTTVRQ